MEDRQKKSDVVWSIRPEEFNFNPTSPELTAIEYFQDLKSSLSSQKIASSSIPKQSEFRIVDIFDYYFTEAGPAFNLQEKTLHQGFNFFIHSISGSREFYTTAATGLWLGYKMIDVDKTIPHLHTIVKHMNSSPNFPEQLKQNEIIALETEILIKSEWNVNVLTPFDFIECLMSIGIVYEDDEFVLSMKKSEK